MNCFYHAESAAVAQCKSCGRGLCMQCTSQIENGTACKGRCEVRAQSIIGMIDSEIKIIQGQRLHDLRVKITISIIGLIILLYGLWKHSDDLENHRFEIREGDTFLANTPIVWLGAIIILFSLLYSKKRTQTNPYGRYPFWH